MNIDTNISKMQATALVVLRILIGWHLFYEGLVKVLNPSWTSAHFLNESQWIFSGVAKWITSNVSVLSTVDTLNAWGLIAIGIGLILGLFSRVAAMAGAALLFLYYLNNIPLIGLEYSVPSEGHYLIVSKTLIESVALWVISSFPTGRYMGLDRLRNK